MKYFFVFFMLIFALPVFSQAPVLCPYFRFGDANCDSQATLVDFEFWRDAYFNPEQFAKADFNGDSRASLIDLEILIRSTLSGFPEISPIPSITSGISTTATIVPTQPGSTGFPASQPTNVPTVTVGPGTPTPALSVTQSPTATGTTPSNTTAPTSTPRPGTPTPTPASQQPTPTAAVVTLPPIYPTVPVGQATYPADVLNLTNWKVTVPIGQSESPTEIEQPELDTYRLDPWFVINPSGGVRFRAPVNATTTSGSNYPRSELREMTNNGQTKASWSSTSGIHTMIIDQAITAVPQTKQHVVAGQIHDAGDDVIVIRLEYPKLFVDINGADGPVLDSNYTLGERFTVKFEVQNGQTKIYYAPAGSQELSLRHTLNQVYSGAYFKAGAYTQSNCGREATSGCTSSNYGEVIIYNLSVSHQ